MRPTGEIRVRGLRELNRAFANISKDLGRQVRRELVAVGEPVRVRAQQLAAGEITNIGEPWAQMRVGATRSVVYVAPKRRSRGGSPRPNLAPLLLSRAMVPAVNESAPVMVARLDAMLDRLASREGF